MTDWCWCAACGTLYPYDDVNRVAKCPHCTARVPYVILPNPEKVKA